jgi:hypothetical protein
MKKPNLEPDAMQLRLDRMDDNLAAAQSVLRTYKDHAEAALIELARTGQEFTADDIRKRIPAGVEAHSPNVLPSLLGIWSAQDKILPVDWTTSKRPSRHSSRNRVWVGNKYKMRTTAA